MTGPPFANLEDKMMVHNSFLRPTKQVVFRVFLARQLFLQESITNRSWIEHGKFTIQSTKHIPKPPCTSRLHVKRNHAVKRCQSMQRLQPVHLWRQGWDMGMSQLWIPTLDVFWLTKSGWRGYVPTVKEFDLALIWGLVVTKYDQVFVVLHIAISNLWICWLRYLVIFCPTPLCVLVAVCYCLDGKRKHTMQIGKPIVDTLCWYLRLFWIKPGLVISNSCMLYHVIYSSVLSVLSPFLLFHQVSSESLHTCKAHMPIIAICP